MYVQSTEARRESHCCEQFERRADFPDEEVDVLFLQRKELKIFSSFFSFYVKADFLIGPIFYSCAPIQLHYNTKLNTYLILQQFSNHEVC